MEKSSGLGATAQCNYRRNPSGGAPQTRTRPVHRHVLRDMSPKSSLSMKLPLTHRDIGRNWDYFAPGHMSSDPHAKRCAIHFIEKRSLRSVTAECVLLEYLHNDRIHDELQKYNDTRVHLFNYAMMQIGLDYEFKCVVKTPRNTRSCGADAGTSLSSPAQLVG
jgi:hypothetical protein